jgi:bacterioferritin-associated ferredoxin
MYVCICNALRDRDIARAAQNGATTVDAAYAALGTATCCGQCREDAEMVIASACSVNNCCQQTAEAA